MDISKEIEARLSKEASVHARSQKESLRAVIDHELKARGVDLSWSPVLDQLLDHVERSISSRFIHDRMTAIVDGLLQQATAERG